MDPRVGKVALKLSTLNETTDNLPLAIVESLRDGEAHLRAKEFDLVENVGAVFLHGEHFFEQLIFFVVVWQMDDKGGSAGR